MIRFCDTEKILSDVQNGRKSKLKAHHDLMIIINEDRNKLIAEIERLEIGIRESGNAFASLAKRYDQLQEEKEKEASDSLRCQNISLKKEHTIRQLTPIAEAAKAYRKAEEDIIVLGTGVSKQAIAMNSLLLKRKIEKTKCQLDQAIAAWEKEE